MTQAAGWYEDPQDPSQLRYWDGVIWSGNVTPRAAPSGGQPGMSQSVTPADTHPEGPGTYGAQGLPSAPGSFGSPQQGFGQQGGRPPAYGQDPGYLAPPQAGWQSHASTTPDGVPLAGWWPRVGARLLDILFTGLLSLPFAGYFYIRYFGEVIKWSEDLAAKAAAGSPPVGVLPPWDVLQYAVAATIITWVIAGAYEVFFLTRSGATPGKKIVGISVRLRDQAGPPPMKAALGRTACYYGFQLINPANLLDILWPLWDDKKQALHDKVVATNVVVGPQPKRDV